MMHYEKDVHHEQGKDFQCPSLRGTHSTPLSKELLLHRPQTIANVLQLLELTAGWRLVWSVLPLLPGLCFWMNLQSVHLFSPPIKTSRTCKLWESATNGNSPEAARWPPKVLVAVITLRQDRQTGNIKGIWEWTKAPHGRVSRSISPAKHQKF